MKRSILAAALLAGTLAGAAGAAVQDTGSRPSPPAPTPTATPVAVPTAAPRGMTADGRYDPSFTQYRVRDVSYPVRVEDPAGGPAWVVKAFDADRLVLKRAASTLADGKVIGKRRCFQVGRLQGTTFGWVFGDGVFRRTRIEDMLMQCTSRKRPTAVADAFATLAIGDPAAPEPARSVVFGFLPGATQATIGAATVPAVDGVFLRVTRPEPRAGDVTGGGHRVRFGRADPIRLGAPNLPRIKAGSLRAEAPAPDPAGGPRWVLAVAQAEDGTPCVGGPTRVVEGRTGEVQLGLGLFREHALPPQDCQPLPRRGGGTELPCALHTSFGAEVESERNDAVLGQARVQRRLQTGISTVSAQCRADVERVTIETPRDIRTLLPSPVGHAVLAVYDGDFLAGRVKLTAYLRGGKTWSAMFPLSF